MSVATQSFTRAVPQHYDQARPGAVTLRTRTPRTAPQGYRSTYEALIDYLRFGPGLWYGRPSHFLTLLHHIERSATWGKEADAHGASQATRGVISSGGTAVRGSAGVSESAYHAANRELERSGFIRRTRRALPTGRHLASEYEVIWPTLRTQLQRYADQLAADAMPLFAPPPAADDEVVDAGEASAVTTAASVPAMTQVVLLEEGGGPVIGPPPSCHRTHKVSDQQVLRSAVSESISTESFERELESGGEARGYSPTIQNQPPIPEPPAHPGTMFGRADSPTATGPIREALTAICGPMPPADPIAGELAALGERLGVSGQVVAAWIYAKARDKQRREPRREWTPGFYRTAARSDLAGWCYRNALMVRAIHDEEQRPERAEVIQMPPAASLASDGPPQWMHCPLCETRHQLELQSGQVTCLSAQCDPHGDGWRAALARYGEAALQKDDLPAPVPAAVVAAAEEQPAELADPDPEPDVSAEVVTALDQRDSAAASNQVQLWAASMRLLGQLKRIAPKTCAAIEQQWQSGDVAG